MVDTSTSNVLVLFLEDRQFTQMTEVNKKHSLVY